MYFLKKYKNPLFKEPGDEKKAKTDEAAKTAKKIGKPWTFLSNKISEGIEKFRSPSFSAQDLINIDKLDLLETQNQITLYDSTSMKTIFKEREINPRNNSFVKEGQKKEEQDDFGSLKKLSFSFSKKEGFIFRVEFDAQYDSSLKSKNTTRLYDYLDYMKSEGKFDWRRDADKSSIIIRININDVFEDAFKSFEADKSNEKYKVDLKEKINKFSEALVGKTKIGSDFLQKIAQDLKNQGTADVKLIKDAQDFANYSLLKKSVESGSIDLELKNQLAEKLASKMRNEFAKTAAELSNASGGDFRKAMNKKLNEFSQKQGEIKEPFYSMAYKRITDHDVSNYKQEILTQINDEISKNPFKNQLDQENLKDIDKNFENIFDGIKNEMKRNLVDNLQIVKDKFDKKGKDSSESFDSAIKNIHENRKNFEKKGFER
jgi:hypothetical protein